MHRSRVLALFLLVLGVGITGAAREVRGRTLHSAATPSVEVLAGSAFRFVGRVPFRLAESEGERYIFVDAGDDKALRRLLVVQFESFLPSSHETFGYDLSSGREMAGLRFISNTFAFPAATAAVAQPKDEAEATNNFLLKKGFKMPAVWLATRYVTIADGDLRKSEMIVFYMEGKSDRTMADLYAGEEPTPAWRAEKPALEERSLANFTLVHPH
ncbi:MAG TPA: hypothetical protein VFV19_07865 [Candidatus Polarisedimenticolaceae bacterium]|nr:hypothetical protein [Candidatus Polarisedimenticolaceae bacterium]